MIVFGLWLLACSGDAGGVDPTGLPPAGEGTDGEAARGPTRAALALSLAPGLVTNEVSTYTLTGAMAGATVSLMGSEIGIGAGPCPPPLGGSCFDLLPPLRRLGIATADATGTATFAVTAPPVAGLEVAAQAVQPSGPGGVPPVQLSPPRVDVVHVPWVSGLAARPPNPTCLAPPDPPAFDGTASIAQAFTSLAPFVEPTAMAQPPGDPDTWWLVERPGSIFRFDDDDAVATIDLVIDVAATVDDTANHAGLLGLAFHPDFAVNGEVFLLYTTDRAGILFVEIARYVSLDGGLTLDPATAEVVLALETVKDDHFGGHLAFGPDGYLYVGIGDNEDETNGQDPFTLFAKMLRIDVDGGVPYAIPPDNPFADGISGAPEVYAIGLRQPWRWSFDRSTGDLWAGDVGKQEREEVSIVERGGNYGWDVMEGALCALPTGCDTVPGLSDPVIDYVHVGNAAVIGGYVYRGAAIPELAGTYVFVDHFGRELWGIAYDEAGVASLAVVATPSFNTNSFAEDADGELYMVAQTGRIFRVEPPVILPPVDDFPTKLSDTGCFDPLDPTVPVEGMVRFEPISRLWSDGASKRRWLAIPDGTTIDVDADGDLELPIGSVLVKEFRIGDRLETRLLVRHDDGTWAGYAYAWDEGGGDATLVDGALTVPTADGGAWRIPSRAECMQCHTDVAGYSLGLEIGQLNAEILYDSTGITANQLFTLEDAGYLSEPLGNTPDQLFALASPATAPDRLAARSYLHANCSHCHQPGGPGLGDLDLRVTAVDPGGCELPPMEGDLGVPGAFVIDPGNAANSILSMRMHATDVDRMPPVATVVVDPLGTSVVDGWIDGLTACP